MTEFFDISGQALMAAPCAIVVRPNTKLDKSLEDYASIVIFSPMFGIGFIPISVFGEVATEKGDMWVDDRGVKNILISGYDLYSTKDPPQIKNLLVAPKKAKNAISIQVVDSHIYKELEDNAMAVLKKIREAKKPFPRFDIPTTSPQFGKLTGSDYRRYISFFKGNVVAFDAPIINGKLDEENGKWIPIPDGARKMQCWADIIDNMRNYYAHKVYMDYINELAPKKFEDVCKSMGIKDRNGKFFPESNHAILGQITASGAIEEYYLSIKDISPFKDIERRDIKIWVYMWKYWYDNIFSEKSVNPTGISGRIEEMDLTKDYDINTLPKDTRGWLLSKNAWGYINALIKNIATNYKLDRTELLEACKKWIIEYDEFNAFIK